MSKDEVKVVGQLPAAPVAVAPVTNAAIPVVAGIPSEGRDIGEYAMRPYEVRVRKPNGKFITYKSM